MVILEDFILNKENEKSIRKLYKTFCDKCNKDRGYRRMSEAKRPYCRVCFNIVTHSNKIVSEETKKKMSESNWLNNGGIHPRIGKHHSEETKVRLSKAAALQCKNYKGKHIYSGLRGLIYMKSSWEVKYANYLDTNNIEWEYEPIFSLSDGRNYLPDFKLSDGTIVEIKGYFRPDSIVKWDLFCKEYSTLQKKLLTKVELKALDIL
jgi:hypothetical protein